MGMTVADLQRRMTSEELSGWATLLTIRAEEQERERERIRARGR